MDYTYENATPAIIASLLSRRCLLSTLDQIYFICRTTYWSEFSLKVPRITDYREAMGTAPASDPYSGPEPGISLSILFYFETAVSSRRRANSPCSNAMLTSL
ncbi:hypothetical protein F5B17DRAFT_386378 [Nemania serpens]|nr:hypothetical protein F5B17DRAFT_386378 [Nemania serpens]